MKEPQHAKRSLKIYGPLSEKVDLWTGRTIKDWDQPAHLYGLIRVLTDRIKSLLAIHRGLNQDSCRLHGFTDADECWRIVYSKGLVSRDAAHMWTDKAQLTLPICAVSSEFCYITLYVCDIMLCDMLSEAAFFRTCWYFSYFWSNYRLWGLANEHPKSLF